MSFQKRLVLCLVFAGLMLAVPVVLWWLDAAGKAAVAAAQERVRAAGLPLTIDEIRPPRVPDEDNAALVIEKIGPLLNALPEIDHKKFSDWLNDFKQAHSDGYGYGDTWYQLDATAIHDLATVLETQPAQEVMDLIHEAITKKGYNARYPYGVEPTPPVPNLESMVQATRLLLWHSRLAASRGRTDEACADVWFMMVLAEFLADEPMVISQLTRDGFLRLALGELELLAADGALSPAWNLKFADRLATLNVTAGLVRSMDEERVRGAWFFSRISSGETPLHDFLGGGDPHSLEDWIGWIKLQRYHLPGVINLESADQTDLLRKARGILVQPSLGYQAMDKKMQALWENIPDRQLLIKSYTLDPSFFMRALWRPRANIFVARVGLALERYRMAKGEYPATLAELAPEFLREVPLDIFTGKPLLYRTEPGGATIYSVGPNLKDDGGVEDMGTEKDDPAWHVGTAALRKFAPPPPPPATTSEIP